MQATASVECPNRIAVIKGNEISRIILEFVKPIYQSLNCETTFVELPGRRGIRDFNLGKVDGELIRQKLIEAKYEVDFARSAKPVFVNLNSLWVHPDAEIRETRPIAYMLGVVWQEQFVADKHAISVDMTEKAFSHYNKGRVSGLITSDFVIRRGIKLGQLTPPPVRQKQILSAELYHYVSDQYSGFMKRFSDYLEANPLPETF